jgi:serine/threonine protein kinase
MDSETILEIVLQKLAKNNYLDEKKEIGGGGFSKVYQVQHEHLGKRVLKIIDYNKFADCTNQDFKRITTRFINEAKLLQKVHHQNVARVYDAAVVKIKNKIGKIEIPYLIMDYINGKNLEIVFRENSALDLEKIFNISREILSALGAIHREGIIHRDIKPSNIMIKNENETAVLIDFGLAKDSLNKGKVTDTGTFAGTYQYMSPEQFEDMKNVKIPSDIYSFGILLYEMLAGEVPFSVSQNNPVYYHQVHLKNPIPNILKKRPGLPRKTKHIINKAMAKKPGKRYQTTNEFLNELEKLKEECTAKTPPKKIPRFIYRLAIIPVLVIAVVIAVSLIKANGRHEHRYRELIKSADRCIEKSEYEKARKYLNQALKLKKTRDVPWLLETVTNKQKEKMHRDFNQLKKFMAGNAPKKEKIEKCRTFLNQHQQVPANDQTGQMVSETRQFIRQLQ